MHSTMLVLYEHVSHCSQKFMPGSSHLAAGNISKSNLTIDQPHLVLCTAPGVQPVPAFAGVSPPFCTAQAQRRLTLFIPSQLLLFQVQLSRS